MGSFSFTYSSLSKHRTTSVSSYIVSIKMRRFLFSTMKLMGCVWGLWLVHNSLISNYIKLTPFVHDNCIRLRILKFQFDFHVIFSPLFFLTLLPSSLFSILCSFFLLYHISLCFSVPYTLASFRHVSLLLSCVITSLSHLSVLSPSLSSISHSSHISF